MNRKSNVRNMMIVTMLMAMSIVFHLVEPVLPIPVPGVKLGLANILGLIALMLYGIKTMYAVNVSRVLIASLLRGILFGTGFWVSLSGVLISTTIVALLYKTNKFSVVGLSVAAAAFHNMGQIVMIIIIYSSIFMIYWMPPLIWLSIPTGLLTGSLAAGALARLRLVK
jgi:heptaprenyl diphosphate synthase